MTKPVLTQSQKRFKESLGAKFETQGAKEFIILTSSSDQGVIRNGGRNGACWAPRSLLAALRRLTPQEKHQELAIRVKEVSSQINEEQDFHLAQQREIKSIQEALPADLTNTVCHIGGGHDHIYPLAMALASRWTRLIIINIDAHTDTRTDEEFHSGTPFRQIARDYSGDFHLFQIGLHPFANSESTLTPLPKGSMKTLWMRDFSQENLQRIFGQIQDLVNEQTLVIFSLDADALEGSEMPGVSAVNAEGMSLSQLHQCYEHYQRLPLNHAPVIGLYELNPVYDTLAGLSMRKMAAFLYRIL